MSDVSTGTRAGARTRRYEQRRSDIVNAASAAINRDGLKNLSVSDLAVGLGLNSTSITYYFKRKELLAAACFDRSLDLLEEQVQTALTGKTVHERVALFVESNFAALPQILEYDGEGRIIARLSDMRAIDEPVRTRIVERYFRIFRTARAIFDEHGPPQSSQQRLVRLMQTHILLEAMHAMQSWIGRYSRDEYPRVQQRVTELQVSGLARTDRPVTLQALDIAPADPGEGQSVRFLDVATQLINLYGYRGASVDRIAAELNVTKGSFYHHHQAKDELVLECYRQSLDLVDRTQSAAVEAAPDPLDQLACALMTLVGIQLGSDTPLVRSTALEALPTDLRTQVVDRSNRIARRFSGMVIDGISAGSIKPIDPLVSGQLLMSSLNVAFELRGIVQEAGCTRAAETYCRLLLGGLVQGGLVEDGDPPLAG